MYAMFGMKRAKEIWMLCRRHDAQQALQWSLVNSVVPADELDTEVGRWCEEKASSAVTTRSQQRTRLQATPTAKPSTAAIVGIDRRASLVRARSPTDNLADGAPMPSPRDGEVSRPRPPRNSLRLR
ncbi:enoyl-CoA hydratase-related protein [Prauserella muralis]